MHTTLVIALYNIGVEHEHLNEYGLAADFFNKALAHNNEYMGRDSHMTKIISDGLLSVLVKYQKKMVIVNAYTGTTKSYYSSTNNQDHNSNSPQKNLHDSNTSRFTDNIMN